MSDLFGREPKPKRVKAPVNPAIRRLVDLFHDEHLARFAFKPDPRHFARFAKDIGSLLTAWPEDELTDLIKEFFTTLDPQILRSDYTPMAFLRLVSHLRLRRSEPTLDTSKDADAIRRATTRRG